MSKKANPFVTNFRWDYRHRLVPVFFPLASSQTSGSRGSRLRTRLDTLEQSTGREGVT